MALSNDNLVASLSGAGVSALATIRIVGPLVPRFLETHFSRPVLVGRLVHGELRDASGVIDDPVVALSAASNCADITVHGGSWVCEATLDLCTRFGFRLAESADDPRLIFPESRSLIDAEVQMALPLARTERAVRLLLAQEEAWNVEMPSDDLDPALAREVLADRSLWHLLHPPTVAIVGLPNAGKSTLANQLFGTERSIVSPVAGTTRDWVGEEANLDGLIVKLIDTPGRHETHDPIERQAIAQSQAPVRDASLVIVLLDATRPMNKQSHLLEGHVDPIVAVNKVDLQNGDAKGTPLAVRLQASAGVGVDELVRRVHGRFDIGARPESAPRWWNERQKRFLSSRTAIS